jgi:hypothetical protein
VQSEGKQFEETWLLLEFCDKGSLQDVMDRGAFRSVRIGIEGSHVRSTLPTRVVLASQVSAQTPHVRWCGPGQAMSGARVTPGGHGWIRGQVTMWSSGLAPLHAAVDSWQMSCRRCAKMLHHGERGILCTCRPLMSTSWLTQPHCTSV